MFYWWLLSLLLLQPTLHRKLMLRPSVAIVSCSFPTALIRVLPGVICPGIVARQTVTTAAATRLFISHIVSIHAQSQAARVVAVLKSAPKEVGATMVCVVTLANEGFSPSFSRLGQFRIESQKRVIFAPITRRLP